MRFHIPMIHFNFCNRCGRQIIQQILLLKDQNQQVCPSCLEIHNAHPKVVCGTLVTWESKILLCRRAIEPCYGLWTLPAGYLELFETMEQGAVRETWEEAGVKIEIEQLYCMYDYPQIGHIFALFKAQAKDGEFIAGPESLEVEFFLEQHIPWSKLAFTTTTRTLAHYFSDRKKARFDFHLETLSTIPDE